MTLFELRALAINLNDALERHALDEAKPLGRLLLQVAAELLADQQIEAHNKRGAKLQAAETRRANLASKRTK